MPLRYPTSARGRGAAVEKWMFPILSVSFVAVLLFLSGISGFKASTAFLDRRLAATDVRRGSAHLPSFAYYITGGRGDSSRVLRLLLAVYHPRNRYLLHLSADAPASERADLAARAWLSISAIRAFGNVDVIGKASAMTPMGSSGLAATLQAASLLLRLDDGWDWFVTLSAEDYPLISQDAQGVHIMQDLFSTPFLEDLQKLDVKPSVVYTVLKTLLSLPLSIQILSRDLIYAFSHVPRNLSFVNHTSDLGWMEDQRVKPIIVDAGIYLANRKSFFKATRNRVTPESFKFFTGSPWVILSRSFIEYCVLGWDNLARTLLLYFTNVLSSQEGYFHSLICNSHDFQNMTVNSDLRYTVWDIPPTAEPHFLNVTDYDEMIKTGIPFARQFRQSDAVLDKIDRMILKRRYNKAVPGAWCSCQNRWMDPCSHWDNANIVQPTHRSEKFGKLIRTLLDGWESSTSSCR